MNGVPSSWWKFFAILALVIVILSSCPGCCAVVRAPSVERERGALITVEAGGVKMPDNVAHRIVRRVDGSLELAP